MSNHELFLKEAEQLFFTWYRDSLFAVFGF